MRRVKLRTEVRRDQIAEAVLAAVAEGGLSQFSVAAVAHRVGITPSALYRHFPSKEAMLEATLERLGTRLLDNVERARAETSDPLEALGRLLALHVQIVRGSRAIPVALFSEGFFHSPRRRARVLRLLGRYREAIAGLVREAQQQGLVRPDLDAGTLALMFIGLFQPAALLWHLTAGRFDITRHARRAWTVFRDGVRVTAAPGRRAHRPGPRASTQEKTA